LAELDKYKKAIADAAGTETFCVLPWIHFATRPNGDMRLCCSANASGAGEDHEVGLVKMENGKPANFGRETPMEAWNNDYMKSVRTTMLDGKIPASCRKCFEEESKGVASKRVWESYTWMEDGVDIPELIRQLKILGVDKSNLKYVFLTHIHLDHSGGLGTFMQSFPDTQIIVHRRGTPHLVDPDKVLWQSSLDTLGWVAEMYQRPVPVKEENIISIHDKTFNIKFTSPLSNIHFGAKNFRR